MLKSIAMVVAGIAALGAGFYVSNLACVGNSCADSVESSTGGLLIIAALVLIPVGFGTLIASKISTSRRKGREEAESFYLRAMRQKEFMGQNVVLSKCPNCGAPLDTSQILDSDIVRCDYCRSSVKFRSKEHDKLIDVLPENRDDKGERLFFLIRGAIWLWDGGYSARWNLYFTNLRIVVVKIPKTPYKINKEQQISAMLDQLLSTDVRHNFEIPNSRVTSIVLLKYAWLISFSGKAFRIEFGGRKMTIPVGRKLFADLEQRFSNTPVLSDKILRSEATVRHSP